MLRRMRRGPVVWQKNGEDHCREKCVGEPEAAPNPEREDSAGSGNEELGCVWPHRIIGAAEESGLHSEAQKSNRADCESFLDPEAIQTGLGNGDLGGRVA